MTRPIFGRKFDLANYIAGTDIVDIIKATRLLANSYKIKVFNKPSGLNSFFISVTD